MINGGSNKYSTPEQFMKVISKIVAIVLCVIFVGILLFSSIYKIEEQEQGIILTFGNPTATVGSGLHVKIPFAQKLIRVNTMTQGLSIGYVEGQNDSIPSESTMITSDFNFLDVDFFVEWKVSDPVKYYFNTDDTLGILKNLAQSCIRNIIGNTPVDDVLTTGKSVAQSKIKELMLKELELYDLGIQVINVTMQDAEPPTTEVKNAFTRVTDAKNAMDSTINQATKYQNEQLPAARANADKITQTAEAYKESRINEARGQVARFNEMFAEYIKNPEVTKTRLFYEAVEDIMPGLKVIIDDGTGVNKLLPLEPFENNSFSADMTNGGN